MNRRQALLAGIAAISLAFAAGGAMAQDNVRIALVVKALGNGFFEAANKGGQEAANELGNVELIYTGKNHSDNSLVVLLSQDRLLFAVDFIPVETVAYRALPDAYPDDWIESLKQVERLDFDTLVPGHGKIGKKEHVRLFREYLEALRAAVSEQIQKGATLAEMKNSTRLQKFEQWQGYADWFPENLEGMYRYLSQQPKK